MGIKLGCCTWISMDDGLAGVKNIDLIKKAGFEYVELPTMVFADLDNTQLDRVKNILAENDMKCVSANCFLQGWAKLVGDDLDNEKVDEYVERAFKNAKYLGINVQVIGSGRSRDIPEGYDEEKGHAQLVEFFRRISVIAKKYDVTVAIEHLRKEETNKITTFIEACEMAKEVNCDNIQVLVDTYHVTQMDEPLTDILKAEEYGVKIVNAHIAMREGRRFPIVADEFADFFDSMKKIGYEGVVSVEGNAEDFEEDINKSYEIMKQGLQ